MDKDYKTRVIDTVLDELTQVFPAIAITGAKGVGKTETAARRAKSVLTLTDPRARQSVMQSYDLITEVPAPVFIDEWQLAPSVWDRVRHAVDNHEAAPGQFLLAGSASLNPDNTDAETQPRPHSGAGRILRLTMRPMVLSERGVTEPTISFRDLVAGAAEIAGETDFTPADYAEEIARSGFPEIREIPAKYRPLQLDSYLRAIVEHEIPENGMQIRRPDALASWMRAYGAATATCTSYSNILDAATPGESDKPARTTADSYRALLQRLYLLEPLEAWLPSFTPLKRLSRAPKHHLVDPALAVQLLKLDVPSLLLGKGESLGPSVETFLGLLFESLVTQAFRVYAEATQCSLAHFRTRDGEREIDLIVETGYQKYLAVEVKYADSVAAADGKHLQWLRETLPEADITPIIIYTGPRAYRRDDGIAVIPFAMLGF